MLLFCNRVWAPFIRHCFECVLTWCLYCCWLQAMSRFNFLFRIVEWCAVFHPSTSRTLIAVDACLEIRFFVLWLNSKLARLLVDPIPSILVAWPTWLVANVFQSPRCARFVTSSFVLNWKSLIFVVLIWSESISMLLPRHSLCHSLWQRHSFPHQHPWFHCLLPRHEVPRRLLRHFEKTGWNETCQPDWSLLNGIHQKYCWILSCGMV